jgi:hypothetical protein
MDFWDTERSRFRAIAFFVSNLRKPEISEELSLQYFTELELRNFNSSGILYGVIAGMDAWKDADLPIANGEEPDWDSGTILGTSGIEKFRESIYKIDDKP